MGLLRPPSPESTGSSLPGIAGLQRFVLKRILGGQNRGGRIASAKAWAGALGPKGSWVCPSPSKAFF